ncbi:MAG: LUD domain-containing protein [Pirellulaceae bacterium]
MNTLQNMSTSSSSSKQHILDKLRRQIVDQVSLPEVVDGDWIRFDDPIGKFAEMVQFAGGSCVELADESELAERLSHFEQWREAKRIFSAVASVKGNVALEATADPHELENLDFVVYPGEFAVAENGAVWLTDRDLRHRVVFFITQFLVLVVRRDSIVHNMHEAYPRTNCPVPGFGLFLSGPSKTADIEQSLVIGAHGCRELQVYII